MKNKTKPQQKLIGDKELDEVIEAIHRNSDRIENDRYTLNIALCYAQYIIKFPIIAQGLLDENKLLEMKR